MCLYIVKSSTFSQNLKRIDTGIFGWMLEDVTRRMLVFLGHPTQIMAINYWPLQMRFNALLYICHIHIEYARKSQPEWKEADVNRVCFWTRYIICIIMTYNGRPRIDVHVCMEAYSGSLLHGFKRDAWPNHTWQSFYPRPRWRIIVCTWFIIHWNIYCRNIRQ